MRSRIIFNSTGDSVEVHKSYFGIVTGTPEDAEATPASASILGDEIDSTVRRLMEMAAAFDLDVVGSASQEQVDLLSSAGIPLGGDDDDSTTRGGLVVLGHIGLTEAVDHVRRHLLTPASPDPAVFVVSPRLSQTVLGTIIATPGSDAVVIEVHPE